MLTCNISCPIAASQVLVIHLSELQSHFALGCLLPWVYFAFLKLGKFTCSSWAAFYDDMLSPQDIDSHSNPFYIQLTLRRSKTDVSGRGVTIVIGRTGGTICPVAALLTYLSVLPATHGPLFIQSNGTPLSRSV